MGGDGGCVNSRVDMVKTVGYGFLRGNNCGGMGITPSVVVRVEEDRIGRAEGKQMAMTTCKISGEKLRNPVVVDRLGNLLLKEVLMEGLLTKKLDPKFDHIRALKDVKTVKLEYMDGHIVDPISKRELDDGVCKSVALWNCGCIMDLKTHLQGQDEKKRDTIKNCAVCNKEITEIITLAPDEKEVEEMRAKLPQRKAKKRDRTEGAAEPESKKDKKDTKVTKLEVTENVKKMLSAGVHQRDGFGCPAYFRT